MKHPITKFPVEPYEAITEEFVQRKYYEYNQLYFAGELPPCKFRFNAMSLYYGCLGQYYGYEDMPEIWIDIMTTYEPDWVIREAIIHEMIHCYIDKVLNVKEKTPHGPLFSKIRKDLNKKYNLGICNCQGRYDYNDEVFAYNIYAVEYEPDKEK